MIFTSNNKTIEFSKTVVFDFTTRYSAIHLDLGNNFTDTHFFEAFRNCIFFEDIHEQLNLVDLEDTVVLKFVGNYGNIEATYTVFDLFCHL